jgi:2-C-methyl-D-erythritol 2,4-cyclodiphosphate synthase
MTADAAVVTALSRLRVASGFDVHPLVAGRPLILAGVHVDHDRGLDGHSDADLVAHAATDALLGAAGMDDIGALFPSDDPALQGADSMDLLAQVVQMVAERGCAIINMDVVVMMQAPRLAPYREQMRTNLARVLGVDADRVTVRATTTDHLGFVGRAEGGAALATCALIR